MSLAAAGIHVSLGGRRVLQDVSLELERGRLLALLGPNGAGKSTLLRVLAGAQRADRGVVTLDGRTLPLPRPAPVARRIGYLAQAAGSAWPLAARDVVALGRLPWRRPWSPLAEEDEAAVTRAMEATDVAQFGERPVSQLSGGERARVMLARVLAGEPEVVLADEPVAGLDPAHQLDVMALLSATARAGAALAVVMHDLTLAARHADRVALMLDGRLHAVGAAGEVLDDRRLRECFGITVLRGEDGGEPFVVPTGTVSRAGADPLSR